jgi:hypothetical protein
VGGVEQKHAAQGHGGGKDSDGSSEGKRRFHAQVFYEGKTQAALILVKGQSRSRSMQLQGH